MFVPLPTLMLFTSPKHKVKFEHDYDSYLQNRDCDKKKITIKLHEKIREINFVLDSFFFLMFLESG